MDGCRNETANFKERWVTFFISLSIGSIAAIAGIVVYEAGCYYIVYKYHRRKRRLAKAAELKKIKETPAVMNILNL